MILVRAARMRYLQDKETSSVAHIKLMSDIVTSRHLMTRHQMHISPLQTIRTSQQIQLILHVPKLVERSQV